MGPTVTAAIQLELDLSKLTEVIGPFAKSIQCLESHSTPADVFLFWVAIMAQLDHWQLFRDHKIQLPYDVVEQIRAITNQQWANCISKIGKSWFGLAKQTMFGSDGLAKYDHILCTTPYRALSRLRVDCRFPCQPCVLLQYLYEIYILIP